MLKKKRNIEQEKTDTLLGVQISVEGNIFLQEGVTRIDGSVKGNITSHTGKQTTLIVNEFASIEGDISASVIFVKGKIKGNLHADVKVTLMPKSEVDGNIYYHSIEMQLGAKVNGKFICQDRERTQTTAEHDPAYTTETDEN